MNKPIEKITKCWSDTKFDKTEILLNIDKLSDDVYMLVEKLNEIISVVNELKDNQK